MKYVHIVEPKIAAGRLAPHTVATVVLGEDGRITVEGDSPIAEQIRSGRLAGPADGPSPSKVDGEAFLASLARHYRSAYLFATDVQEGAAVEPFRLPEAKKAA